MKKTTLKLTSGILLSSLFLGNVSVVDIAKAEDNNNKSTFESENKNKNKNIATKVTSENGKNYLVLTATNDVENINLTVKLGDQEKKFKHDSIKAGETIKFEIVLPADKKSENSTSNRVVKAAETDATLLAGTDLARETLTTEVLVEGLKITTTVSYDVEASEVSVSVVNTNTSTETAAAPKVETSEVVVPEVTTPEVQESQTAVTEVPTTYPTVAPKPEATLPAAVVAPVIAKGPSLVQAVKPVLSLPVEPKVETTTAAPVTTVAPVTTTAPVTTKAPVTTAAPKVETTTKAVPATTVAPVTTTAPVTTAAPKVETTTKAVPATTVAPVTTKAPVTTAAPKVETTTKAAPATTVAPVTTKAPVTTAAPKVETTTKAAPATTEKKEITKSMPVASSNWRITSGYNEKRYIPSLNYSDVHNGVDIVTDNKKEPILSTEAGKVVFASKDGYGGNGIIIRHGDGNHTYYWHLAENNPLVKVGQSVKAGQRIGTMGTTGMSTGVHLHFTYASTANWTGIKDPMKYLADVSGKNTKAVGAAGPMPTTTAKKAAAATTKSATAKKATATTTKSATAKKATTATTKSATAKKATAKKATATTKKTTTAKKATAK